ncbi:MAG: hypothetical protein LBH95_10150 [Oscillospiraceae bacterium]|jgi:hypothetical protein|nr:hypothetical protein [Oscillospiraceae bacterium]
MIELTPAEQAETGLFFRLEDAAAERHGAVCGMRIDFEANENGVLLPRFDCQRHLKTPAFKADLKRVMGHLRGGAEPFGNPQNFAAFCYEYEGESLNNDEINVPFAFGVRARTEGYSYYFRCQPLTGRVNIFAYDNNYLLPELAGKHELPNKCFSLLPSSGDVIIIERGTQGYTPFGSGVEPHERREEADNLNAGLGVTRAQEEAMLAGSLFGWNAPGAKPWRYNQDGTPRPLPPKRKDPER